jgi:plastocyanin
VPSSRVIRRSAFVAALVAGLLAVAAVSALAATASVGVADNVFSAKHLTVSRGTRVFWKWTGVLYHNVTVRGGPARFHSRTQAQGTFSHAFTRPGTYTLYCTIHKAMKMTVVVR